MRLPATTISFFLLPLALHAIDDEPSDKSQYWFAHRTPAELMRPITTDGIKFFSPHSAYTVDAGHVQLENSFTFSFYDSEPYPGDKFSTEATVWSTALRFGLCNWVDLKVAAHNVEYRTRLEAGSYKDVQHFGRDWAPVDFSFKANVWGNDGGRFALALERFIPTN